MAASGVYMIITIILALILLFGIYYFSRKRVCFVRTSEDAEKLKKATDTLNRVNDAIESVREGSLGFCQDVISLGDYVDDNLLARFLVEKKNLHFKNLGEDRIEPVEKEITDYFNLAFSFKKTCGILREYLTSREQLKKLCKKRLFESDYAFANRIIKLAKAFENYSDKQLVNYFISDEDMEFVKKVYELKKEIWDFYGNPKSKEEWLKLSEEAEEFLRNL